MADAHVLGICGLTPVQVRPLPSGLDAVDRQIDKETDMFLKLVYGTAREEVHEITRAEWWEEKDKILIETDSCLLEIGKENNMHAYLLNNEGKTIERLL